MISYDWFCKTLKMYQKIVSIFICCLCCVTGLVSFAYASGTINNARDRSDADDLRMFLKLRSQLQRETRKDKKRPIYFAFGEYHFKIKSFHDAQTIFRKYARDNIDGIDSLLANVYLYKIAQNNGKQEEQEEIKQKIFASPFILLFDEYKTINYISVFGNEYEVRYFVDKIEVFLNGEIFEQINP